MVVDVSAYLEPTLRQSEDARGISRMAQSLAGSAILAIAGQVRAKIAAGEDVLNLTVGDFAPTEFPIPDKLRAGVVDAVNEGWTNYPPATGVAELREAVRSLYERRLGLDYPLESVLVAGGARPFIAGAYLALVNPGDKVVFGLPSWNNHYYCTITGAQTCALPTTAENNFFVRNEDLIGHLDGASLLVLNTPQNPTGTVLEADVLEHICEVVVEENRRRAKDGTPSLYVLYDQIYWLLTNDGVEHHNPVSLVPEMAPYTIFVDGISKGFAATGLRVGWSMGPPDVIRKMGAILSHMGAWAPKPEQLATAHLLNDDAAIDAYLAETGKGVLERLGILSDTIKTLKAEGHDVDCIPPQGAIYLSIKLDLKGKKTASGEVLRSDEDVRRYLLDEAGIAVIPFTCFGVEGDIGWFRASVGAVSVDGCKTIADRLRGALGKLS